MLDKPNRNARIEARISPEALRLVKRASELQGRSVSDFVVTAAREAAERAIEDAHIFKLSLEDQRALAAAILKPPTPTPAMRRAIDTYRKLVVESR